MSFKPDQVSGMISSPGSTYDLTRSQGGFNQQYSDLCSKTHGNIKTITRSDRIPPPVVLQRLCERLPTPTVPEKPLSKVLPIAEQGNKWRIVTKSPFEIVLLGQKVLKSHFSVLFKYRGSRHPLVDADLSFYVKDDNLERKVYSADLSNATDYLSHEAIASACKILRIDEKLVKSHDYETQFGTKVPKRGTFMGLPPSWIVLSTTHMAVCYVVDPSGRSFYIKGDDLIAYWTKVQWERYLDLMSKIGFKMNLKKSFISSTRGIFCEKPYKLSGTKGWIQLLEEDYVSLRFITKRCDGNIPGWVSRNKRLYELLPVLNSRTRSYLRDLFYKTSPPFVRGMASIPVELGGASLPKHSQLTEKVNFLGRILGSAYHDGQISGISTSDFELQSDLNDYVQEKIRKIFHGVRKFATSNDQDMVETSSVSGLLSDHLARVALTIGKGLASKRKKTYYLRSRSRLLRDAFKADNHRLKDITLEGLYELVKGSYIRIKDIDSSLVKNFPTSRLEGWMESSNFPKYSFGVPVNPELFHKLE
nr:MAG: RNA-dependent RNA polymerase [Rhizoctonia solani narnavirus 7]